MAKKAQKRTPKELDSLSGLSCRTLGKKTSMTFSKTYVAAIVSLLGSLGLVVSTDELSTTISVLITIGGFIGQMVQRYQKGDVHWSGMKK